MKHALRFLGYLRMARKVRAGAIRGQRLRCDRVGPLERARRRVHRGLLSHYDFMPAVLGLLGAWRALTRRRPPGAELR